MIEDLNPVLRGWGNYFRTGNATARFNQLDTPCRGVEKWTRDYFHHFGLHRLRGTVRREGDGVNQGGIVGAPPRLELFYTVP